MKIQPFPAVLCVIICTAITSFSAEADLTLADDINANAVVADKTYTSAQTRNAFRYVPSTSFYLSRVEFYTSDGTGDFTVRLYSDSLNLPGNLLAETILELSGSAEYQGKNFERDIFLERGMPYWLSFYSENPTGSHFAKTGLMLPNCTGQSVTGTWNEGPITWLAPMIRLYGRNLTPPGQAITASIYSAAGSPGTGFSFSDLITQPH